MLNKLKLKLRKWLGVKDVYYIQGKMPELSDNPLHLNNKLTSISVNNLGISRGDIIEIHGMRLRVENTYLQVTEYKP